MRENASGLLGLMLLCSLGQAAEPAADSARFIARLPRGTVELLGVTRFQPADQWQWWRADGSAADLGQYRPPKVDSRWASHDPQNRVTFFIRIKCLPGDTSSTPKAPPPKPPDSEQDEEYISASDEPWPAPSGPLQHPGNERRETKISWPAWSLNGVAPATAMWEGHAVVAPDGRSDPEYKMFSTALDPSAQTADFGVGISTGIWEMAITRKPDDEGTFSFRRDGRQWFVTFHKATPGASAKSTQVRITLACREFYAKLYTRLLAVDADGRRHSSLIGYTGNNGMARFRHLPLPTIKEIQFQVRPYDWVEFKNVSVRPGKKTDVEVVSSDEYVAAENKGAEKR